MLNKRIWFLIGFVLTAIVSTALNMRSYHMGSIEFHNRPFQFSHTGFHWGFPLRSVYEGTCSPCYVDNFSSLIGFWANVLLCLSASVTIGLVFRLVVSRLRRSNVLP